MVKTAKDTALRNLQYSDTYTHAAQIMLYSLCDDELAIMNKSRGF